MAAAENLKWEEVAEEEWDVACLDNDQAVDDNIEVILEEEGGAKSKRQVRSISKADREHAATVHRSHLLCLLARALAFDRTACSPELQARVMSLIDSAVLQQVHSEVRQAVAGLNMLLHWFQSKFTITPPGSEVLLQEHELLSGRLCSTEEQVLRCLGAFAGPLEALVTLFVALLRGQGQLVRFVRLLDAVPLRPWLSKQVQLRTRKPTPLAKSNDQLGSEEAKDNTKANAGRGAKQTQKRGRKDSAKANVASSTADETDAAEAAVPPGGKRPRRQPKTADTSDSGGDQQRRDLQGRLPLSCQGQVGCPAEQGRPKPSTSAEQPDCLDDQSTRARINRGEEEFQRELAMAMQATAAATKPAVASTSAATSQSNPGKRALPKPVGVNQQSAASSKWPDQPVNCWVEVYCGSSEAGRWVPVDILNGYVDRPDTVDSPQQPTPFAYVVGCCQGRLRDITKRYITNPLTVQRARDEPWWSHVAQALHQRQFVYPACCSQPPQEAQQPCTETIDLTDDAHTSCKPAAHAQDKPSKRQPQVTNAQQPKTQHQPKQTPAHSHHTLAEREDAELSRRAQTQLSGLPVSVEGFKNHPLYLLQRHIGKYEAVQPGTAPIAVHRGEPVYPRSALSVLHTVERWRREGRVVREAELSKPVKEVKKRALPVPGGRRATNMSAKDEDGTEGSEQQPTSQLYGMWQTDPWQPPIAQNGMVPKNERGNVECPPFAAALPVGTVHLQYQALGPLCRQLGIDWAPALVGFDMQGGRMVPRIDGVVVCEEYAELVVSAYVERETARAQAAEARAQREMEACWRQLLDAMRKRQQLEELHQQQLAGAAKNVGVAEGGCPDGHQGDAQEGFRSQQEQQHPQHKDQDFVPDHDEEF